MLCSIFQGRGQTWGLSQHSLPACISTNLTLVVAAQSHRGLALFLQGARQTMLLCQFFFDVLLKSQWLQSKREVKWPVAAQQERWCPEGQWQGVY